MVQVMGRALLLGAVIAGPALGSSISSRTSGSSQCQVMNFTVSGTAYNRNITGISTANLTAFLAEVTADQFPLIEISGPQTLSGIYCTPTGK